MRRVPLALFVLACVFAQAQSPSTAPAVNWALPIFTDKEGFRSMTLRGSAANIAPNDGVAVTDLNITVFSGDAAARVTTVFLSPAATFYPKTKQATGTKAVRIVRDDLEATGTTWTYDHAQKRVTLDGNVRIVLNLEIKDLLK